MTTNKRREEKFNMFKEPPVVTEYDKDEKKSAKPKEKSKKASTEKGVHVFMKWPKSMKERFDDLYYADKEIRKNKSKNDLLTEWCLAAIKKLEKQNAK